MAESAGTRIVRKQAEGHSRKEAMRALKRRVSDAVYRQLVIDACH